jgi:hypothetical protein
LHRFEFGCGLWNNTDCKADNESTGNNKEGAAGSCTPANREVETIAETIRVAAKLFILIPAKKFN